MAKDMNIKVLRIIARLNIGGPARNAVLLTHGLGAAQATSGSRQQAAREFTTVLVCGEISRHEGDMMYFAREKGIEPIIIKELGRRLSLWSDWLAFWKIYKIVCREKPHIIHTHTAKAGALGRLAGILYNITNFSFKLKADSCKLIHTFHGHVLHSYFGKIKTWFFIWIEKILALFTDRIITVSGALKKELVEIFRIAPESKLCVVELGFELEDLLGLSVKEERNFVNIGIVGRLTHVKNHTMFLRVAKKLKANSCNLKTRFLIIGDGELRPALESYVKELGIEDIVEFRGWVRDLRKIYEEMDIVALTSLNEGTPVSIIEAMAAARPVVATEVGGVKDVVQDEKSGYLVDSNDEAGFSEKLFDLARDSYKRKRFGEYGRGLVKYRFSKERLIKDTERLCNNVLQER